MNLYEFLPRRELRSALFHRPFDDCAKDKGKRQTLGHSNKHVFLIAQFNRYCARGKRAQNQGA